MDSISATDQLTIFSRYIGQQVMMNSLLNDEVTIGTLTGVKQNAIMVTINDISRWIPVYDNFTVCEIKLLLKPLKKLNSDIIAIANSLPVKAFIPLYYQQLGFDMPVFISPGHAFNSRYVQELNLADYRTTEDILQQKALLNAFESA